MTDRTQLFKASILLIIMSSFIFGTELTQAQRQKLHPVFRSIAAGTNLQLFKTVSGGIPLFGAIVYTHHPEALRTMGIHVNSVLPEFLTAQLSVSDLTRLASLESVQFLEPGKIHKPLLDVSVAETGAKLLHDGFINNTPFKGKGAIVLIFDTGIDWKHFDFRQAGDTTKSRILCIWDQTADSIAGDHRPDGFNYGVEYTQAQIEGELDGTARGVIREKDVNGHGTHVTSVAAGNGQAFNYKYVGMAPEADIIVVKGGDDAFSETGEIDGLTYAQNKSGKFGKPIVVNMSLGGQEGAHDGTEADEIAVDNFVKNPGRIVCIAAGNDGAHPIHINGEVSSRSPVSISVVVPNYFASSRGSNYNYIILDMWLATDQAVNLTVNSPSNISVTTPFDSDTTSKLQTDGTIDTWDHIESQNGHRHVQVWIHDASRSLPKTGTWTMTLSTAGSTVPFDGWLDSNLGGSLANLPAGNTNKTVAMPATASGAITVASYITKWTWVSYTGSIFSYGPIERTANISTFSSIGPTATGDQKPDLAAPGQAIVAALSSDVDITGLASNIVTSNKYQKLQGTSMSCPHVTGAAALLLSAKPGLTATQIKYYLLTSARADTFTSAVWNAAWGYGKLDVYKAMDAAVGAARTNRVTLSYNGGQTTAPTPLSFGANQKIAMRFTPTIAGKLSGITVSIKSGASSIRGTGNLKVSAAENISGSLAGIPSGTIGTSILIPLNTLSAGTANVIDMSSAGITVASGTDFQIVLETTNETDTLQLQTDDGSLNMNRTSSYRTGSTGALGWYNMADPNYASPYTPISSNVFISADIAAPVTTAENRSALVPASFTLKQNYPNPFNPATNIDYSIPVKDFVKLQIFDVLGRLMATLVDDVQEAGVYHTVWTGMTSHGAAFSSGVYFYQLKSGNFSKTGHMLLLK